MNRMTCRDASMHIMILKQSRLYYLGRSTPFLHIFAITVLWVCTGEILMLAKYIEGQNKWAKMLLLNGCNLHLDAFPYLINCPPVLPVECLIHVVGFGQFMNSRSANYLGHKFPNAKVVK